jgi:hypothetical protein
VARIAAIRLGFKWGLDEILGVPGRDLAEHLHHRPQVRAHRLDRALRVAGDHPVGDRAMFEHRRARPARPRHPQVADPVELGLGFLDHVPGVPVTCESGQHRVHRLVGAEVRPALAAAQRSLELAHVAPELGPLGIVDPLRGEFDDPALEGLAHEMRVADRLHVDAGDEGPDLGNRLEQAVLGQPLEGLAHRCAAHAVVLGDPGLGQRRPGLEHDRDDLASQVGKDLRNRDTTATRGTLGARTGRHGGLVY